MQTPGSGCFPSLVAVPASSTPGTRDKGREGEGSSRRRGHRGSGRCTRAPHEHKPPASLPELSHLARTPGAATCKVYCSTGPRKKQRPGFGTAS